jgi:hypothetical protein
MHFRDHRLRAFPISLLELVKLIHFQGLPRPDVAHYPADRGEDHTKFDILSVGVEQVRRNFERFGLLNDLVGFIVGWFKDTLAGFKGSAQQARRVSHSASDSRASCEVVR